MPNWGALNQNDNALSYFQTGMQMGDNLRKRREEGEVKNALAAYAANPDDPKALAGVIEKRPELGLKLRDSAQQAAAAQKKAQFDSVSKMAQLLNHATDEGTYQQSLAAAKSLGMDTSTLPANYDAAWVGNQRVIVNAFEKDGGVTLTNAAKQVGELGYDINTPEGKTVLAQLINAGHARPYVDEQGRQRLYTGGNVAPATGQPAVPSMAPQGTPQPAPQAAAGQQAFTPEQFRGLVSSLGRDGASRYLQKNAMPVQIANASDYEMLPAGASYIDPNGVSRVKGQ